MGTTLTGTTPQDTYDSLIKVTDNGPLSGSLKKLTDGLGNDSSLSLSTTAASFSGTLAVSGASTFSSAITMALGGTPRLTLQDTDAGAGNVGILFKESTNDKWTLASNSGNFQFFNEATASNALFISSTNNVGIGTSSPIDTLQVNGGISVGSDSTANNRSRIYESFGLNIEGGAATDRPLVFRTNLLERMRISYTGVVELALGQIKFPATQVPSADPNTLDDYEEGTWTIGISFGGASVGVTTTANTGTYTKIGRQVSVSGNIQLSSKGSSTGIARITGLPFVIGSGSSFASLAPIQFENISFTGQLQPIGAVGDTVIVIQFVNEAGVNNNASDANFTDTARIAINFTYFV